MALYDVFRLKIVVPQSQKFFNESTPPLKVGFGFPALADAKQPEKVMPKWIDKTSLRQSFSVHPLLHQ